MRFSWGSDCSKPLCAALQTGIQALLSQRRKHLKQAQILPVQSRTHQGEFPGRRKLPGESLAKTASSHQEASSKKDEQGTLAVAPVCSQTRWGSLTNFGSDSEVMDVRCPTALPFTPGHGNITHHCHPYGEKEKRFFFSAIIYTHLALD